MSENTIGEAEERQEDDDDEENDRDINRQQRSEMVGKWKEGKEDTLYEQLETSQEKATECIFKVTKQEGIVEIEDRTEIVQNRNLLRLYVACIQDQKDNGEKKERVWCY